MISEKTGTVSIKKRKKKGILFGLMYLGLELHHLLWGDAKPSEECDEYRYYDSVDYLRQ